MYIFIQLWSSSHTQGSAEKLWFLFGRILAAKNRHPPVKRHCGCPIWGIMGCPPSWDLRKSSGGVSSSSSPAESLSSTEVEEGGLPETCCLPPDACHILVYTSISQLFCGCFCSSVSYVCLILILLWGTYFSTWSFSLLSRWLWNVRFLFHWWWCLHGLDAILQIASSQFHL